jgi:putative Mn2+ efflux pump MntP
MILWTIAGASPAAFSLLGLLFVSVSLGLSNFAAAIGIGLSGVDAQTRLKTGLIFGFFEALMPILGLLLGQGLAGLFGDIGHYGGAGLLILTGVYTLWQTRKHATKPSQSNEQQRVQSVARLLITGFAISLDNLVVGFALSLYHVPILLAALVIAATSVGMSLIGLELGRKLGERIEQGSEIFGGAVLILVGLALAFHLL